MTLDGELLDIVCRRIANLDRPAYIKNSELRYVAVNDAYARFFGRDISDFIGNRSQDLLDAGESADREDKERRALVFGSEEVALCFDAWGRQRSRVEIESFSPSEDRVYIFGVFLAATAAARDAFAAGAARRPADEAGFFRSVLEGLPVATFVRDSSHRLIYANAAHADITGLDRDEMLGKTEHEMFAVGADDFFVENEAVLREGRGHEFESEIVDRRQVTHPVKICLNRATAADGKHYAVGSVTDTSALKQREMQLIEAQARAEALHQDLDNILRSMPIGVLIHNGDYIVEYVNDAFYDIWEYSKEDRFEGRPYRDIIAKHYELARFGADGRSIDDIYQAWLATLGKAGEHRQTEVNFADGKSVIIDARQISNGRTLMSYTDISSVKQQSREITETRLALEHLGELMADAMQAMSQGLLIVQDGAILLANDRLKDMLKLPAELTEVGRDWSAAFDYCAERGDFGNGSEALLETWAESIAASKPISCVFQVVGDRWIQLGAAIGEHRRWTVVFTDVTEMKEREADLQLLLARSNAADRAKSEFLTHMSHEIRTPMNGVLGMAELLGKTDLDPRQKTFVDIIVKSGNALLTIINDILDFSRIDTGDMHLRKMAFDPAEAVEDIATLLAAAASEKNIELMVRIAPGVPAAMLGDAGRFRQIVTNLVGNAIKFTERGHVLVELDSQSAPDDNILLVLRIEDTGIGIPAEKLDTIFDKFSLADSSFARRLEGSGLGLAITAGLVDLFGGSLSVESEWGKGSVFTVHLSMPLVAPRAEVPELPANVKRAGILIVEDDEAHRRILTEQLAQWGFDSHAAEDGKTALAILDAAFDMGVSVEAIIVDYSMPGMSGYQIASAVRADPRFEALPIVFLTSMGVAGRDKDFTAVNGQAHLMKPVRANVLRNTIIDVVRASRRKKAGEQPDAAARPLPLEAEAAAAIEATDRMTPASPGNAIDVLVAEDNEVNQIVFTQILQATGLRFLVVENGQAAVDAWRQLRPSLILMDVSMPVMNGHQATRMIRQFEAQVEQGWHVPIIGVTAQALDVDRIACMQAGMDDCLSKPISPELLEDKIQRYLGDVVFRADRFNSQGSDR
ncbi:MULTISPECIES: response regulator [unclassified Rhizobium]|uniref:response regulator n=1 Tax=unclassified Rhizobium TaxID=2613769 RepID=UPI000EA91163|nr:MULTISPECIES: response regulator [unclassified Rhizobium]AYG66957.1 response regulator [Rhizobium sp. CCGE531]AYG73337.1 response regulator [Rhizobium sp. CCGE532]